MTRAWTEPELGNRSPWAMYCDRDGCGNRSEARPSQAHLPLDEFAAAGWHIERIRGDRCPVCVAAGLFPANPNPLFGLPRFIADESATTDSAS